METSLERVPHAMVQFILKIAKLSPILEIARAYGLRPRLWLLKRINNFKKRVVTPIFYVSGKPIQQVISFWL